MGENLNTQQQSIVTDLSVALEKAYLERSIKKIQENGKIGIQFEVSELNNPEVYKMLVERYV